MKTSMVAAAAALTMMLPSAASATILTFDVDTTRPRDVLPMPQSYGDRVTATVMGSAAYGVGTEGFTPNIVASYFPIAANLTRWSDYGSLQNVFENEDDGDTSVGFTLTADAGYMVTLFELDLGGYAGGDYTIPGLSVRDGAGNVLYSAANYLVRGSNGQFSTLDFGAAPLTASALTFTIDLTGLGGDSDNIGIDNVRFGQRLASAIPAVPEPSTWAMMLVGFGLTAGAIRRRRRPTVQFA